MEARRRLRYNAEQRLAEACSITRPGQLPEASVCLLLDPRQAVEPLYRRAEAQLQARGLTVVRLPRAVADLPVGTAIAVAGRVYSVEDPGLPVTSRTLVRSVGCEEVRP